MNGQSLIAQNDRSSRGFPAEAEQDAKVLFLTQIRELLRYEPETGQLYWRVTRAGTARAGTPAGSVRRDGYRQIKVLDKVYQVHRLVWFWVHGEWPTDMIDHINGDPLDNRLANLRAVSVRQNSQNRNLHRAGRLVGCSYDRRAKRWKAQIYAQKKKRHLGHFDTEQEAHEAYLRALEDNKE